MFGDTKQSTFGDQSPNINGDGNVILYGTKNKLANEVETMLKVIILIPEVARERGISSDDVEYSKDLLKKINERFTVYQSELKNRFNNLDLLYRNSYEDAKRNTDIDEFGFEEMCSYLRNISIEILKFNDGNPLLALKEICRILETKFSNGTEENFSAEAIEYFLYKQLVECNIFPNPTQI